MTETLKLLLSLDPQSLLAVTEMVPPLGPVVVVIELLVDEPVHPEGKLHVYDVAAWLWQGIQDPECPSGHTGEML